MNLNNFLIKVLNNTEFSRSPVKRKNKEFSRKDLPVRQADAKAQRIQNFRDRTRKCKGTDSVLRSRRSEGVQNFRVKV